MDTVNYLKLDDMKDEEKEIERRQNNIILYNVPEKVVGKTDKIIVEELIHTIWGSGTSSQKKSLDLVWGQNPCLSY